MFEFVNINLSKFTTGTSQCEIIETDLRLQVQSGHNFVLTFKKYGVHIIYASDPTKLFCV